MNKIRITPDGTWTVDVSRLLKLLLKAKILRCNVKCKAVPQKEKE